MPSRMVNGRRVGFAVRKDRVTMAHQHDVAAGVAGTAWPGMTARRQSPWLLRQRLHRQAVAFQEAANHRADRVDARLVVAAAVDIDHFSQHRDHGVLLGGEPGGDVGFRHGCLNLFWRVSCKGGSVYEGGKTNKGAGIGPGRQGRSGTMSASIIRTAATPSTGLGSGRNYARRYWLFAAPAAIVVAAVILFPWIFTLFMSVHDWKVTGATPFVGLANYAKMLVG